MPRLSSSISYRNRRAFRIENEFLNVTVLAEGGHVAEILDRKSGMNPLWTPPWPTIEPSLYDPTRHPEYGRDAESKLLAGIMGHNLCMDMFGGPSSEEERSGQSVHGEASVAAYEVCASGSALTATAELPNAGVRIERRIRLAAGAPVVLFTETAENLVALDKPTAWTEHVTIGPPFLERGRTQFRVPATLSKVDEYDGGDHDILVTSAEFHWPFAPRRDGGTFDLRVYTDEPRISAFTTHLLEPARDQVFFAAFSPSAQLAFGYVWRRSDFPWIGIWDENRSRVTPPWNGETLARGLEFGVSPYAETRRQMIERGKMFGTPTYRWIPAKSKVTVEYAAFLMQAARLPEDVFWDGAKVVLG